MHEDAVSMTSCSAATFRFRTSNSTEVHPSADGSVGSEEFFQAFRPHDIKKQSAIHLKMWVANHYRWIVWKSASMERSLPGLLLGRRLTVSSVYSEICQRYFREIVKGDSSALKHVYQQSEPAKRLMILCVSRVIDGRTLELTDGWYVLLKLSSCGAENPDI